MFDLKRIFSRSWCCSREAQLRAEEWLKSGRQPRIQIRETKPASPHSEPANGVHSQLGYRAKLKICKECDAAKYFLGRIRCDVCGCFMELKAAMPAMHCPLKKW